MVGRRKLSEVERASMKPATEHPRGPVEDPWWASDDFKLYISARPDESEQFEVILRLAERIDNDVNFGKDPFRFVAKMDITDKFRLMQREFEKWHRTKYPQKMQKEQIAADRFLHNHPVTEKAYNLPHEHVIVDREDWEKIKGFRRPDNETQ